MPSEADLPPDLKRRIPELDGLRGLAIALVILWHYVVSVDSPAHGSLCQWLGLSWSGVDLFFVLSGFLIGGILLEARQAQNYFSVFFIRRSLRILPLYYLLVLGVALGSSSQTIASTRFGWIVQGTIPLGVYPIFMSNVWNVVVGGTASCALVVCWSLAVEEQFYWTLPLAVRWLSSLQLVCLLGFTCLAAPFFRLACVLHPAWLPGIYTLLPCRADDLGMGVLAAVALRRPGVWQRLRSRRGQLRLTSLGLLAITLGLSQYTFADGLRPLNSYFTLTFTMLGLFYLSLLLLALVDRDALLGRILRCRPLTQAGLLCYGLYLIHLPVREFLLCWWVDPHDPWLTVKCAIPALAVTVALAYLCWYGFEKRLIILGHRLRYRTSAPLDP